MVNATSLGGTVAQFAHLRPAFRGRFGTFGAKDKRVRMVLSWKCGPGARPCTPCFLQWEAAVIRHSGPGRGTIAQTGAWLLTPSHWTADKAHLPESWALTQLGPTPFFWMTMKWKERTLWATWSKRTLNGLPSISSRFLKLDVITSTRPHGLLLDL